MPNNVLPFDPLNFHPRVWEAVRRVPPGRVTTYGQVAAHVPAPEGVAPETYQAFGARWVGSAMAACPGDVPWQRVVNSEGRISPRGGAERQRQLLEAEGVVFDTRGRIDLREYAYDWGEAAPAARQASLF